MFGSIMRRPDVVMVKQWRAAENDIKKDSLVWKDVTVETQHGAFYDVDADCIGITKWIDWNYNRQWGKLLSLSGTSMFVSVAPDTLPAEQEKELSQMLIDNSVRRPAAESLDWQETAWREVSSVLE